MNNNVNQQNGGTFCPKCGKQTVMFSREMTPANNQFHTVGVCQSCGYTWQTDTSAQQPAPQVMTQQTPSKKKNITGVIALITICTVAIIGIVGAVMKGGAGNKDKSSIAASDKKSNIAYEVTDTSFNYHTNSIGNVSFHGIVEITNTGNTNIYLNDCSFDLEDNDGHLLQSESMFVSNCPDIIAPGEKGYIYNGIGANLLDKSVSIDNGLNLVPHYKVEKARGEIVEYEVTDTAIRRGDYGGAKVTGRITNTSGRDDSLLYVTVLFKDASGKVLTISGTNVLNFTAGSTVSFEVSSAYGDDAINMGDIANYEVIAQKAYFQF